MGLGIESSLGALSGRQTWGRPKGSDHAADSVFLDPPRLPSTAEVAVHVTDRYWWPGEQEELRGAPPGAILASLLTSNRYRLFPFPAFWVWSSGLILRGCCCTLRVRPEYRKAHGGGDRLTQGTQLLRSTASSSHSPLTSAAPPTVRPPQASADTHGDFVTQAPSSSLMQALESAPLLSPRRPSFSSSSHRDKMSFLYPLVPRFLTAAVLS